MNSWELMATHLGRDHDETPEDKHTTLEDKIAGGNETLSWYDKSRPWKTSRSGYELRYYPHRDEMRRRWREQHPDTSYSEMLARLSTCMGDRDRMNKCRDVTNTPLALQGISDRMQDLLDDNLERSVHEHGVRTHSPSDGSPIIYRHPAGKLALRNASDQWGRPAGKTTHTGKAVAMSVRNSSASFEQGLDDCDDDELTEMNVNTLAVINNELSDSHRKIVQSKVRTSGAHELAAAETALAQLNCTNEHRPVAEQNSEGEALEITEASSPYGAQSSFFAPSTHPLCKKTVNQVKAHGTVHEGLTEESHYSCEAPARSDLGYTIIQDIGKDESRAEVLVSTPICETGHAMSGHQGIYVNFPDTPDGGPGTNCRDGYYTQAMQISTNDEKHPYVEQWCEPTSVQRKAHYEGRQDFWTSVRSRGGHTHRWLGSLWKQMEQINEVGDEARKGIKQMALGPTPIPEMRCSSSLPVVADGKVVVQREYVVDLSETPPVTTYRLRIIRLNRPWCAHDLQAEWRRTCDRMSKQSAERRALIEEGLGIMETVSSLVESRSELLEITCCPINMEHLQYIDDAGDITRTAKQMIHDLRNDRHSRIGNPVKKDHNEREAVTRIVEEWATRIMNVAWPPWPESTADEALKQKIRSWARKYMYIHMDDLTWVQVLGGPPPVTYQNTLRALMRIDSELRYYWEKAENEEYRRLDTVATGINAVETLTDCADAHGEASKQAVAAQDVVSIDTGYLPRDVDASSVNSLETGGETTSTTTTTTDTNIVMDENTTTTTTENTTTTTAAAATPAAAHSSVDSRPWWQKGYDDIDGEDIVTHHFKYKNARVTNIKDASTLLHEYLRISFPRALGLVKLQPSTHAQRLVDEQGAVQWKGTDERHLWLEAIERDAPDLGRVLRRCIGLYASSNLAKSKDALEYYAATGDPNPRAKRYMRKQIASRR